MFYYWVGVWGSLAVEIAAALKICTEIGGHWPPLYKKPAYVVIRTVMVFGGAGPLAMWMSGESIPAAVYIGASAPLIIDQMAKGLKPSVGKDQLESP